MNRTVYLLFILVCLVFISPAMSYSADSYEFSMLPRYFPKKIKSMINPLAEYLSNETGMRVNPVLTKDFLEYENQLKNGEIEIGYENPLIYVKVSASHEVVAMAVKGEGGDRFRGIIITRPDSDIQSIEDLKHKKIMIVGETSAGGFLSQKLTLLNNGLVAENDCDLEIATDNKQENVIISVSIGDVDAGFIRESALHIADQYIQPGTIKVMSPCDWLPNWAFSVNRSLPDHKKEAIRAAIIGLEEDSPVLKAMGITSFKVANDGEYDVIRDVLK